MCDISLSEIVQFPHPTITAEYDFNQAHQVAINRTKELTDAAQAGYWIAVAQNPFSGIGHVSINGRAIELINQRKAKQ